MAKPWQTRHLDPSASVRACLALLTRTKYREMRSFFIGASQGLPEPVHDMRVSARRLLTLLEIFGPYYPGPGFADLREALRGIIMSLGKVRDSDVFISWVKANVATLAPQERRAGERLLGKLEEKRSKRLRKLNRALKVVKRGTLGRALFDYIRPLEPGGNGAVPLAREGSFRQTGPSVLPELFDAMMREAGTALQTPGDDEALHRLRLMGKQLRYTMELYASFSPQDFRAFLEDVKGLLDLLGQVHECDVAIPKIQKHLAAIAGRDREPEGNRDRSIAGLRKLIARQKGIRRARLSKLNALLSQWEKERFRERLQRTLTDLPQAPAR